LDRLNRYKSFKDWSIFFKLVFLALIAVVPGTFVLFFLGLPLIEERMYEEKRLEVQQLVELAHGMIGSFYQRVADGKCTVEEAQQYARESLLNLRYSESGYFWVHHQELEKGYVIIPYWSELMNRDLHSVTDIEGRRIFVEMAEILDTQGGAGFLTYQWPKPGTEASFPKVSYFKLYQPWDWVIGTGIYIDRIEAQVTALRRNLLWLMFVAFALASGLVLWLSYMLRRPIEQLDLAARAVAAGELDVAVVVRSEDEIGSLSASFNRMVATIKEALAEGKAQRLAAETTAEALRNSEERYRHLVESALAVVWQMDPASSRITFVSQKVETLLGYPVSRWLGEPDFWRNHIHSDDRDKVITSLGKLSPANGSIEFESRMIASDGRVVWLRNMVNMITDQGKPVEWIGVMVDITERLRLERQVLKISDQERRRIGQDLHDGLGSHLTGVAMRCRGLARRREKGRTIHKEEMDELANLVQEAVTEARHLARGLNPVKLEKEGLKSALQDLARAVEAQCGIPCIFTATSSAEPLDGSVATHLYRIAQEALTNAIRHANATTLSIRLASTPVSLALEIHDNGIGLPVDENRSDGMGLRVMFYRAHMIGAQIDVDSTPGKGTIITCTLSTVNEKESTVSI